MEIGDECVEGASVGRWGGVGKAAWETGIKGLKRPGFQDNTFIPTPFLVGPIFKRQLPGNFSEPSA